MYSATYSPEDNKLRLYAVSRLPEDVYKRVRAAGFIWAPKQELFVAPAWTPHREDLLFELCDDIGDEDYSPEERAADRAERFAGYRDNRRDEANDRADTFESGPAVFGHQNRARAKRQAARHDRHRAYACSQWSKAEYWQTRTAAVIGHALHKSSAAVRRGRLLRLEAEQRKHEKSRADYAARFAAWQKVATLEGCDTPYVVNGDNTPAGKFAYALANHSHGYDYAHPRTGRTSSLYSLLTDPDPITPAEAAGLWLRNLEEPTDPESYSARWSAHYVLRVGYENAMLANEGGTAADVEMEPGGWIGKHQIHAINKSPVTGRVVSVKLMAPKRWYHGEGEAPLTLQSFNIERMGESAYRAPTDEEREAFKVATKTRKATEKASKPAAPSLINPTDEDAETLQAALNEAAKAKHDLGARNHTATFQPSEVLRMPQAKYSELSKGTYSSFETRTLHAGHKISRKSSNMWTSEGSAYDKQLGPALCKLRIRCGSGYGTAPHVVVITDKPQKPLPVEVLEAVTV
jgi:hypothetical protein